MTACMIPGRSWQESVSTLVVAVGTVATDATAVELGGLMVMLGS